MIVSAAILQVSRVCVRVDSRTEFIENLRTTEKESVSFRCPKIDRSERGATASANANRVRVNHAPTPSSLSFFPLAGCQCAGTCFTETLASPPGCTVYSPCILFDYMMITGNKRRLVASNNKC